jgi:hypothetical protein
MLVAIQADADIVVAASGVGFSSHDVGATWTI